MKVDDMKDGDSGWIVTCSRCDKVSVAHVLAVGTTTDTGTGEKTKHPVCPSCRRILLGLVINEKDTRR